MSLQRVSRSGAVIVLTVGILGAFAPSEAAVDYCGFSDASTLLLVDRTTFYDDVDKTALLEGLEALYNDLGIGDRLIVHTITNDRTNSEKVFDGCLPGCPESGLLDWVFSQCRAGLARSDLLNFRENLAKRLQEVLYEHEEYPHSAIIETVAGTTSHYAAGGLTRVVIFSDLLENSSLLPWPDVVRRDPQQVYQQLEELRLLPSVSGTPVVVFGIGRGHDPLRTPLLPEQRLRLAAFWQELLALGGGSPIYIDERYR